MIPDDLSRADWLEFLIFPALFVFFALLFRLLAWSRERQDKSGRAFRILAWVPVALGLYVGLSYLYELHLSDVSAFRMASLEGRKKLQLSFYAGAILPILGVLGIFVWNSLEKRLGRPLSI